MKKLVNFLLLSLMLCSCATSSDRSNSFSPDAMADHAPFIMNKVYLRTEKMFSNELDRKEAYLRLHPRINSVTLDFNYGVYDYALYLSKSDRDQLRKAIDVFLDAFEKKSLSSAMQKKSSVYGTIITEMKWGKLRNETEAEGSPQVGFAYTFTGSNPYFVIYIPGVTNKLYSGASVSKIKYSVDMFLYFSRTEAEILRDTVEQNYLVKKLKEMDPSFGNENRDRY